MKTFHIIVSGRVQGVCFRAYTQKQAVKHDITGFVRNQHNGDVEIVACSESDKLERFISDCDNGPIMASVEKVTVNEYSSAEKFTEFRIL
jgi:acylphosphatase